MGIYNDKIVITKSQEEIVMSDKMAGKLVTLAEVIRWVGFFIGLALVIIGVYTSSDNMRYSLDFLAAFSGLTFIFIGIGMMLCSYIWWLFIYSFAQMVNDISQIKNNTGNPIIVNRPSTDKDQGSGVLPQPSLEKVIKDDRP
jgi:CDP-diglyceride synthetase